MQEIGEFNSIFTFWQHWNYFPHADPALLFEDPDTNSKIIIEGLNQSIEAIGVFVDKVKPAWEDSINKTGCDICIRKYPSDFKNLKELWQTLVLSLIGETIPFSEDITGCRVVDKKTNYKFELWLRFDISKDYNDKANAIKNHFAQILQASGANNMSVSSHQH